MSKLKEKKDMVHRLACAQEENRQLKRQLRIALGRLEFLHGLTWERATCGYINNLHWINQARVALELPQKVAP